LAWDILLAKRCFFCLKITKKSADFIGYLFQYGYILHERFSELRVTKSKIFGIAHIFAEFYFSRRRQLFII